MSSAVDNINKWSSNGTKPRMASDGQTQHELLSATGKQPPDSPDPDTIKMFVGQIPKGWDEAKLTQFFEEFGPVYQMNVLREKETDVSRGCCFVTFYHRKDAINAQNALHNIRIMPGLSHPVQMKPADIENRNERKLFIGMLSKSMTEEDVKELFKEFGQIEDCSILREDGKSKGCAFLTFVSRSCAHQAIRKMNHSQIFEGCNKPMVCKFADSGKDKNLKKEKQTAECSQVSETQHLSANNESQPQQGVQQGLDLLNNLVTLLKQPGIVPLLESVRSLQQLQQPQPTVQQLGQAALNSIDLIKTSEVLNSKARNILPADALTIANTNPQAPVQTTFSPVQASTSTTNLLSFPHGFMLEQQQQQPYITQAGAFIPSIAAGLGFLPPLAFPHIAATNINYPPRGNVISPKSPNHCNGMQRMNGSEEKNSRGPDGCNLFIYHLPQEFTDNDLYSLFSHFGAILSAKVFVDKQTNLSKCFGFVSYADESSAQSAISGMNGFQIGNKRLKVQLKRSDAKPYDKPSA